MPNNQSADPKLLGMLGLAMRAGKVTVGTEQVCLSLAAKRRPYLVLVSVGASDATKRKLKFKCEFYGVECIEIQLGTEELGRLLGKTYTPACAAIADDGFARELVRLAKNT